MARKRKADEEPDEDLEQADDEQPPGRGPQPPRVSVTVTPELRKKIRIAAARADLEIGEWCKLVILTAASKTVAKLYPDDEE